VATIVDIGGYNVPVPEREIRPSGEVKIHLPKVKPASEKAATAKPKASEPQVSAPPAPTQKTFAEMSTMLSKVNLYLDQFEIQARYSMDPASGNIQIEVRNNTTGEVIRRIPPYEAAKLFQDPVKAAGLLLDQKV
jgi:uncharacterized FlaG/YvyC family protein